MLTGRSHWRRKYLAGLFAAALVATWPSTGIAQAPGRQTLPAVKAAAVDRELLAEMEKRQVVGMAVGIIREGRIVYLKGYGLADREKKIPVDAKTMFRWASCSKPLTAIAALQLAERRKLDLDADVRKLVPEFPDKGAVITTRQLLCHQGGIVHYTNGKVVKSKAQYSQPHPFEDVVVALDAFKESPLVNRPGEKSSYSTHGFMLLSAVVERAGEQRFADQVRDRIARPLGMKSLQPDYQWIDIRDRAIGYRNTRDGIVRSADGDVSWKLGGGGFISNIEDFALFAEGLINRRLVSEAIESAMWRQQKLANGEATGNGLGFSVDSPNGKLRVAHNGAQEKTRTRMVIYPRDRHGVVFMTNCEWANPSAMTTIVYKALAGN